MSSRNALNTTNFCMSALLVFLCGVGAVDVALAQTQLGADIDGEAADDQSGVSVSLSADGNQVAIGARHNDGNGTSSGHVRVYTWTGAAWTQLGADIDGEAAGDQSGFAVSLSADGNRVAIGTPLNDDNGTESGHVRVYQWSGVAWVQLGADIDGEAADDFSGWALSLSADGNRVAVGATGNDGNGSGSGHVRVYTWTGAAWTQLGADIDGEAENNSSGSSVSLSADGNRVAVGARGNDGNGTDSGHVRVYTWTGAAWTQLGAAIDGEAARDESGRAVALSADGNRVAVGASGNDGNGTGSGHVRVYQWSGRWTQLGADIDGEAENDQSGFAVSLSADGNRVAIGAGLNDGNGTNSGHVRVYTWLGAAWTQLGADIDGEAAGNSSGFAVSLSADGNRVAIGSEFNEGNGSLSGHVRVYRIKSEMNAGHSDAWFDPNTDGQGFFISVFPDLGVVFLAWFTYDTQFPAMDAEANLGDPGHRWLTAQGMIDGDQSVMDITVTSGGLFDTPTDIDRADDGTITLSFEDCKSGTIDYDIPSIDQQGSIPIQRIADDKIALCEAL